MDPPEKNASHLHHQHEMSLRAPLVIGANNNSSSSSIYDNPLPIHLVCRMFVASDVLQVSPETRFTAIVLLYRYATVATTATKATAHVTTNCTASNNENENNKDNDDKTDWPFVAGACLFLACKAEEEHRRLRDIVNVIFMILKTTTPSQSAAAAAKGTNSTASSSSNHSNNKIPLFVSSQPPPLDDTYWNAKKRVIESEQTVLRWLGFDCYVSHPHRAIVHILQNDDLSPKDDDGSSSSSTSSSSSSSNHPNKRLLINTAFRRINDALFYPKALQQFSVLELACAAIELAVAEEMEEDNNAQENDETTMLHLFAKRITNQQPCLWTQKYQLSRDSLSDCKRVLREASVVLEVLAVLEEEGSQGP